MLERKMRRFACGTRRRRLMLRRNSLLDKHSRQSYTIRVSNKTAKLRLTYLLN